MASKDKYIVHFISKTKNNMIKFIENKLVDNSIDELIPSHGNILTALYEADEALTMKDIAKKIGKDKSTVTVLINKLISLGYVEKSKSKEDKRFNYIKLTNKAHSIECKYNNVCEAVKETAYNGFTEKEKEEFFRLLKKINDNFKENI